MDVTDVLIELGTLADDERRRFEDHEAHASPTAWAGREHEDSIRAIYAERARQAQRRLDALRFAINNIRTNPPEFNLPENVIHNVSDGQPTTGKEARRTPKPVVAQADRDFVASEFGRERGDDVAPIRR